MGTTKLWSCVLIFLSTLALQGDEHHTHAGMGDRDSSGAAWGELNRSMHRMHVAAASIQPSGKDDVDFVKLMLPHHQAAIDMAKTQLLFGKDPAMRRLAQEILIDQQSEIELMQLWLKREER